MDFLRSLNISGSGMTAQRLRMDIISQNIANAEVTKTENGTPYRRKMVVLRSVDESGRGSFKAAYENAAASRSGGVEVEKIVEDQSDLNPVYDPDNPDADENGYVMLPNVNTAEEMIDMLGASRAYEANVTAFNAVKSMAMKALEIGE